jgi:hypothetical protein
LHQIRPYNPVVFAGVRKHRRVVEIQIPVLRRRRPPQDNSRRARLRAFFITQYGSLAPVILAGVRDYRRDVEFEIWLLRLRKPPKDKFLAEMRAALIAKHGSRTTALRNLRAERDTIRADPVRFALSLEFHAPGRLQYLVDNAGVWLKKFRELAPEPPDDPGPDAGESLELVDDDELEWRVVSGLSSGPPPPKIKTPARGLNQEPAPTRSARYRFAFDVADHRDLSRLYSSEIEETADFCAAERAS